MKKRILACLLALVMLIGIMPVMAMAAEAEVEKPAAFDWKVSRSKTATDLDADGSTRVTLSLPSAEENLATDVLLVLDASKCAKDMLLATIDLIDDLNTQVEAGANIKVGIVMFKGNAVPFLSLTEGTDLKALMAALTSPQVCSWRRTCSPKIPLLRMPASMWSLLQMVIHIFSAIRKVMAVMIILMPIRAQGPW